MKRASSRGSVWFSALTAGTAENEGFVRTIQVADAPLGEETVRFINIAVCPENPFPRVRQGEAGLQEGWNIAKAVCEVLEAEKDQEKKSALVALVDVKSQAYGRTEETYGIHQALGAAAAAYARARQAGHPVLGLIVGKGMSGGFLAHGYQANRLIALNDPEVSVHAMGKEAAARITLRSVESLEALAKTLPPMAYDIQSYHQLGLLWKLLTLENPDAPSIKDIEQVTTCLIEGLKEVRKDPDKGLKSRYQAPLRKASREVREKIRQTWKTSEER